ncbi:MAG: hypothetical protein JRG93_11380 [Deltaproteobacteria bacterium]|nr:hypothetical protein [Deltaproteobacteria bacterium]
MIASRTLLVAAVIAALCVACGHDKRAMKTVTSRASFDLSCPQAELELTILATSGARRLASQIGVTGCGNKVVYVYFASTDSWIADSAITPAMTQRERAYKAQQAREDQAAEVERRFEQQQSYQRGVSQ